MANLSSSMHVRAYKNKTKNVTRIKV